MVRKANILLKIIIFILVFALGFLFFKPEHGGGPVSAFIFIGESIVGASTSDTASIGDIILSFIISVAIYYLVTEILTYIILKLFGRKD